MQSLQTLKVVFRLAVFLIAYGSISRALFLLRFHPKKDTFKNLRDAVAFFLIVFFMLLYLIKLEILA